MATTIIHNVALVGPDGLAPNRSVCLQDGKIKDIGLTASVDWEQADESLQGGGMYLAPGFIDLHIHGLHRWGIDNGPDDFAAICEGLPQYGVTGFLPTLAPRRPGEDSDFLATLAQTETHGTLNLGFHLEGPFLTQTGALPPEALGKADPNRVRDLIEAARPHRAVFSISPDFENIEELIPIMLEGGVVFITHTAANVEQTKAAIEAGARHATHFCNVFIVPPEPEPGVRPCGALEAILADPRVSVDFILDGEHVPMVAVELALRCKQTKGVCLITDANVGAGLPPGRYAGLGREVVFAYEGGPARIADGSPEDGWLAGSGLTMDRAVRNAVDMLGMDLCGALAMASTSPARVLGLDDHKGRVEIGFDADLVLLDQQLQVQETWVAGERVYTREESGWRL